MLNGYTAFLNADPGIDLVCNLSLGASHPPVAIYRWSQSAIARCSVVIIDLNVNEQFGYLNNAYSLRTTEDVLCHLLAKSVELGFVPLIAIMPEAMSYASPDEHAFASRTNWLRLCKQYDIPFFDGYQMLEDLCAATSCEVLSFLKDPLHLDDRLHLFYANCLARAAGDLIGRPPPLHRSAPVAPFEYVSVTSSRHDGSELIQRTTSAVDEALLLLRPGCDVTFSLHADAKVVAVVFNLRGSNAALRISGADVTTKNLNTPFFDHGESFWLICAALLKPVATKADTITLSCVTAGPGEFELNDHGNSPPTSLEAGCVVEVAGLVVASAPSMADIPAYAGNLDLWHGIVDDECIRLEAHTAAAVVTQSRP